MSGSYQTIITGERGLSRLPLPGHCTNYKLKYILSLSVKKKPIYLSWSFSLRGRLQASHTSAAAKSLQSCPSLCDPIDGSPPGCPVPGSLQARTLEWVAILGNGMQCMQVKSESEGVQLCLTLRDPMDCSPPGFSVHGIFQARVLEWGAIAFSVPHI